MCDKQLIKAYKQFELVAGKGSSCCLNGYVHDINSQILADQA